MAKKDTTILIIAAIIIAAVFIVPKTGLFAVGDPITPLDSANYYFRFEDNTQNLGSGNSNLNAFHFGLSNPIFVDSFDEKEFGKAISFDGEGDKTFLLPVVELTDSWSMNFWFQVPQHKYNVLIGHDIDNEWIAINSPADQLVYRGANGVPDTFSADIVLETWNMYTFVSDGTSITAYFNGNELSTKVTDTSMTISNIGTPWYGTETTYDALGKLDELAIWQNRELTQAEITELYNAVSYFQVLVEKVETLFFFKNIMFDVNASELKISADVFYNNTALSDTTVVCLAEVDNEIIEMTASGTTIVEGKLILEEFKEYNIEVSCNDGLGKIIEDKGTFIFSEREEIILESWYNKTLFNIGNFRVKSWFILIGAFLLFVVLIYGKRN